MNDPSPTSPLEIIIDPDQPTIVSRRSVKAPRRLVFDAFTKPELIRRWKSPGELQFVVCELDLRVGGAWRAVHRAPNGSEFGLHGVYLEVDPPARIVRTLAFDAMPEYECQEILELVDEGGRTTIVTTIVHQSLEVRDRHVANAGRMDEGMELVYASLDALLASML